MNATVIYASIVNALRGTQNMENVPQEKESDPSKGGEKDASKH